MAMQFPIVTDELVDRAIQEAKTLLKVLQIIKRCQPEKRAAVLYASEVLTSGSKR